MALGRPQTRVELLVQNLHYRRVVVQEAERMRHQLGMICDLFIICHMIGIVFTMEINRSSYLKHGNHGSSYL